MLSNGRSSGERRSDIALGMTSCKAWRTYTTTATYSVAPDKSGNPVTTIQTRTCEEYTGVKKN